MAWSVVQATSTASSGTTVNTASATYASALTTGNKAVAVIGWNTFTTAATFSSVTCAGTAMTQCAMLADTTNQIGLALYALDVPSATAATVTSTFSSGQTYETSIWIAEVSGLATGNTTAAMLDGTAAIAGHAAAGSTAQSSYTSSAASEFLVACGSDNGGPQTVTAPSGYTLDTHSVTNNASADAFIAYKNSTGGAESGTWTFGGTTTGTALGVVAFKVAGGGSTSGPPLSPVFMQRPPAQIVSRAGWRGAQHSW